MAQKFKITIDTYLDPAISVQLNDGNIIIFKKFSGGLYYFDTTSMEHNIIDIQVND